MTGSPIPPAWRVLEERGVARIAFDGLEQIPWVAHAVSVRDGGGDADGAALRAALGLGAATPARVTQVHGDRVLAAESGAPAGAPERPRADGLVTGAPGVPLEIRVADCVPIFTVDLEKRAIGLAHAGWRGTLAAIASRLVEAMAERYGSRPSALAAWIGPSIGPECFEVGGEVADSFRERFGPGALTEPRHVDLWEANRLALLESGIPGAAIRTVGLCTRCRGDLLHSHRGSGGGPGRNIALLALRA